MIMWYNNSMTIVIPGVIKTAISLPRETYRQAEKFRRKAGKSRSQLYVEALQSFLKAELVKELEERYAAGYKKHPETPEELAELEALSRTSMEVLGGEDW